MSVTTDSGGTGSVAVAPGPTYVDVQCPSCGEWRSVTLRTAKRGFAKCRSCLNPPVIPEVDDEARLFWLSRFSDAEILQLAVAFFGGAPNPGVVAAARERLHGAHA